MIDNKAAVRGGRASRGAELVVALLAGALLFAVGFVSPEAADAQVAQPTATTGSEPDDDSDATETVDTSLTDGSGTQHQVEDREPTDVSVTAVTEEESGGTGTDSEDLPTESGTTESGTTGQASADEGLSTEEAAAINATQRMISQTRDDIDKVKRYAFAGIAIGIVALIAALAAFLGNRQDGQQIPQLSAPADKDRDIDSA